MVESPTIPLLSPDEAPKHDRHRIVKLAEYLKHLSAIADEFWVVVLSYNEIEENLKNLPTFEQRASYWWKYGKIKNVMAQNCAMLIYDFYRVQQAIGSVLSELPFIKERMTRSQIKKANNIFQHNFPDFAIIRHAAAHDGEMRIDKQFEDQKLSTEPSVFNGISFGVPVKFAGCVVNDHYTWTLYSRHVSYLVTINSSHVLRECCRLYTSAFHVPVI